MPFTADDLVTSSAFFAATQGHARQMAAIFSENTRLASVFASQQRWLMAQLGLALHYGRDPANPATGLYAGRFVSHAVDHGIASKNTAASFIQEMLVYRFARYSDTPPDRRVRPFEPTDIAVQAVMKWLYAHLAVLDGLDDGKRIAELTGEPAFFERLQPAIAQGILENHQVRNPGDTFNLFTWANYGGVVMDSFIAMMGDVDPDVQRIVVGPVSFADICQRCMISKTHLKRLLSKAAEMGSLGFEPTPERNTLWLSQGFVREYRTYQAEKFAIIDAAFHREAASARTVRQLTAVP